MKKALSYNGANALHVYGAQARLAFTGNSECSISKTICTGSKT